MLDSLLQFLSIIVQTYATLILGWLAACAVAIGIYIVLLPFLPSFVLLPKKKRLGFFQDSHGGFHATKAEADAATKVLQECHQIGHVDLGPDAEKRRQEHLAAARQRAWQEYD